MQNSCTDGGTLDLSIDTFAQRSGDADTLLMTDVIPISCKQPTAVTTTPYLSPEPKSVYELEAGSTILIDLGTPIDPSGGELLPIIDYGEAACCLTTTGTTT